MRLKVDLNRGCNARGLGVHLLNLSVEGRAVDLKKGGRFGLVAGCDFQRTFNSNLFKFLEFQSREHTLKEWREDFASISASYEKFKVRRRYNVAFGDEHSAAHDILEFPEHCRARHIS